VLSALPGTAPGFKAKTMRPLAQRRQDMLLLLIQRVVSTRDHPTESILLWAHCQAGRGTVP
jgi:hypothetical protein